MKLRRLMYSAFALCTALAASPAHAHFLWGEVTPETPAVAKLAFSDGPGEVSEGNLVERIEDAKVWDGKGKNLKFKTADAVRSGALKDSRVFASSQFYGVLDKTKEGRGIFRLMYFAKSAQTLADANATVKLPVELFAQADGGNVVVTAKRNGQLFEGAKVDVYLPGQDKATPFTTDAKGEVRFEAKGSGLYGLKTLWTDETPGKAEGKEYPFTRNYSTLTFRYTPVAVAKSDIPQSGEASMGMGRRPQLPPGPHPQADKKAYELLKNASENRQTMPEDFVGFSANVTYINGDAVTNGTLVYRRKGETQINFKDLEKGEQSWLSDKIFNLLGHRRGGGFNNGDGRYPLSLNALPANSFGTLIDVNDGMRSQYRVQDKIVKEVTREMGGTRFTISVIETIETEGGKYLANHFIVSYRDAKTGNLKQVEGYHDTFSKFGEVWLPTARHVFTTDAIAPGAPDTPKFQIIKFSNVKILKAEKLADSGGTAAH